jgi:hypothetical protein
MLGNVSSFQIGLAVAERWVDQQYSPRLAWGKLQIKFGGFLLHRTKLLQLFHLLRTQTILLVIPDVLSTANLSEIQTILARAKFIDG